MVYDNKYKDENKNELEGNMNGTALSVRQVSLNVRAARVLAGFKNDTEFAKEIGLSKQNLYNKMNGSVKFKDEEKKLIAKLTGKEVKDLFGLDDDALI